jgi:hypothetical protein
MTPIGVALAGLSGSRSTDRRRLGPFSRSHDDHEELEMYGFLSWSS